VLVGGQDVTATDVEDLRRRVGVVTQRTELLAATLEENITLFADVPPGAVERASRRSA
jgi:ABC-type multidrug transport system fused ATPase/permease subunit